MAHCTLIARINASEGTSIFVTFEDAFAVPEIRELCLPDKSRPRVCSFGVPISIYR